MALCLSLASFEVEALTLSDLKAGTAYTLRYHFTPETLFDSGIEGAARSPRSGLPDYTATGLYQAIAARLTGPGNTDLPLVLQAKPVTTPEPYGLSGPMVSTHFIAPVNGNYRLLLADVTGRAWEYSIALVVSTAPASIDAKGYDHHIGGTNDADELFGTLGSDLITGGDDDDQLYGLAGDDHLDGGTGNDLLSGGPGADYLNGGAGFDRVYYAASPVGVTVNLATGTGTGGDAQGDVLKDIEMIIGSLFDDVLTGDDSNNTFRGLGGADMIDGGGGNGDAVSYSSSKQAVQVNLSDNKPETGGDAQGDVLKNIEDILGSYLDDVLTGDDSNNWFWGLGGADTINGRGGTEDRVYYSAMDEALDPAALIVTASGSG